MATEHSTAVEHLSLETLDKVKHALFEAAGLFDALDQFDLPEGEFIGMGERGIGVSADTVFSALIEHGKRLTREALDALEPSAGGDSNG